MGALSSLNDDNMVSSIKEAISLGRKGKVGIIKYSSDTNKSVEKKVVKKKNNELENKKSLCTKRNPAPPCDEGFVEKLTKKGNLCCYKEKKTQKDDKKNTKNKKKVNKNTKNKKQTTCTKRNPSPPCKEGFIIKKNKKGNECCYKGTKKDVKSKKNAGNKNNVKSKKK